MNPLFRIAEFAESQLGTQEDKAHTNRGAAILKYQQATNLEGQGWPWCAGFVDWCVEQAMLEHPEFFAIPLSQRPQTAAAFGLQEWGAKHIADGGHMFFPTSQRFTPQRGDLVVFVHSHCGIVTAGRDRLDRICTVEGNTNSDGSRDGYAVCAKRRHIAECRAFIRIPVKAAA